MQYSFCIPATFLRREKRFTAYCLLENGKEVTAHVRNTGRCAELLSKGCTVYLDYTPSPTRKNDYTLFMVKKEGGRLINIDSQSPNKLGVEGLLSGKIHLPGLTGEIDLLRPETTFGQSRFDIYLETKSQRAFVEIKGVTLEKDNIVYFPDAPTLRGIKHVDELIVAKKEGYLAYLLFIVQMENPLRYLTTNDITQPALKIHLLKAKKAGVRLLCYSSRIDGPKMDVGESVPIRIS